MEHFESLNENLEMKNEISDLEITVERLDSAELASAAGYGDGWTVSCCTCSCCC